MLSFKSFLLSEGSFKYHMDKAVAAKDRGDVEKVKFHLDNAKTARYAIPTNQYSKHKDLFDKYRQMTEEVGLDEAHKLGDKVIITRGPKDVVGKTGHIGEIRKRWAGDTKTYTIDHEGGSIQLKPTHFKKHISESAEKHGVLAFGRMNPITSGHEAVINKVHEVAKKHNATHTVVVSHSQDAKKNPLSAEQKVKHAKRAFPDTNIKAASKESPTIMHHAAEMHKQGVEHLHVVAGSDRKEEMHNLLNKYNTGEKHAHGSYKFKSITVHSSGKRDPDAEGTTGISASKMREHAASGNQKAFHAGAPSKMSEKHKEEMYHDVRKGMGIPK